MGVITVDPRGLAAMPIYSATNLYPGVNAHLNSFLQTTDGAWHSFHAAHIIDLARTLRAMLPDGYLIIEEQSMQIAVFNLDIGVTRRALSMPDLSIYGTSAPASAASTSPAFLRSRSISRRSSTRKRP